MISVDQAVSILAENSFPVSHETVPLENALGRTTSKPLLAFVTLPPHDASAMDGYAVRLEDVRTSGAKLRVIGEAPAGKPFLGEVNSGETVRVFTGSQLPKGADHIVIQENTKRNLDNVEIRIGSRAPQHIRRAGIDFKRNDILVDSGKRIGPAEIALVAAANHSTIAVWKRPKIAFIASGDELIRPGSTNTDGRIVSSNPTTLSALVKQWGGTFFDAGLAQDNLLDIETCIRAAQDADIIVPIGGASVGNYDLMRQAFKDAGAEMIFEKIAVKPGKPTWFAKLGNTPVLGLPGNPASAIVCAHLFLRVLMNITKAPTNHARLYQALPENGPRETYLRGRAFLNEGSLFVLPFPRQDSSLLLPFRDANVLIKRHPNADRVKAGNLVDIVALGTGPSLLEAYISN